MGVQGLWQLLQPVARPIKLETLEGKRLAIDSSIWLYHFQMAMRDKEGRTLANAHILGFLWRILKLLFYGIRPVFVFDGGAPVMKRRTLTNRKARRQGAKESHARTAEKLLAAQLRQAAVRHVAEGRAEPSTSAQADPGLDENTVYYDDLQQGRPQALTRSDLQDADSPAGSRASSSHNVSRNASPEKSGSPTKQKKDWHKDPYALPALDRDLNTLSAQNGKKGKRSDYRFATEGELRAVMSTIAPEDLDTESELFRSLPPELQYELVGDLRAQSRMTSYKRLQSMLATAPTPIDFSRAQIAGLKTRNDLTQKVLTVTDEIGSANIKVPLRVAGERNKEYVLVRNPGAEGGFVLGVRDSGTSVEKAIDVDDDHERIDTTDDEQTHTDPENELELDEVEIPQIDVSDTSSERIDPEVQALRGEADPVRRKEKALEILQMRAKQHARQARKEAGMDVDDFDARPRPARRLGEKPLFIRDFGSSRTDAIDLAADDEDEVQSESEGVELTLDSAPQERDAEMDADEAEDLSRALHESEQDQHDAPRQLYGFGLSSRGGEPISLHAAMKASSESQSASPGPKPRLERQRRSTDVPSAEAPQDAEEDDIEFEDVEVPAPAATAARTQADSAEARNTIADAPAEVSPDTALSTSSGGSDRMKELARLIGRGKAAGGSAPAPPRKTLAGSLRALRPSPLSSETARAPTSAGGDAVTANGGGSDNTDQTKAQQLPASGPDTPERKGAMGPPSRSASQQRLEMKRSPSVQGLSTTVQPAPSSSADLSIEKSPIRELKKMESALQVTADCAPPRPTPKDAPPATARDHKSLPGREALTSQEDQASSSAAELNTEEMQSAMAAGVGIGDDIADAIKGQDGRPSPQMPQLEAIEDPSAAKSPSPAQPVAEPAGSPGTARRVPFSVGGPTGIVDDLPTEPRSEPNAAPDQTAQEGDQPATHASPPIELDNIPSAATEAAVPSEEPVAPSQRSSREGTPFDWSPTPSPEPLFLGADGFPLPTAEELDAMEAEDEAEIAQLAADQSEFAAFLSASKGRSLLDVQQEVENEVTALRAEHANSRKSEEDITRQMAQEIQLMLRLFGLPYITAPMEAEAQCAELVSRRLVDGIITDDSDVFLFGGTRIYKNMFNNNKVVECFLLSDLQRELGLDREKLVRLAYFLGSDYTEGLPGVGPVLAMELLALFSGQDGLLKFRDWWNKVQMGKDTHEDTRGKTMRRIKKALRNKVHLAPSWPEPEVLDAYYQPTVDESDESFQWGLPDLDGLRTFLGEYLHWPVHKTDQYLLPIIEKQNQRSRARGNQSTLDRNGFFDTTAGLGVYAGRKKPTYGSNRLQEVVNGFRAATKSKAAAAAAAASGEESPTQAMGKGRAARRRRRDADEATSSEDDDDPGSSSSDGIELVEASLQPHVPEELLGKEMGKRRPIVRRDEAIAAGSSSNENRISELDAAVEALEGKRPEIPTAEAPTTKGRKKVAPAKAAPRGTKRGKGKQKAAVEEGAGSGNAEDGESSSSADEWRPTSKRGRGGARGRVGRGRGRGRGAASTASNGPGEADGASATGPPTGGSGRGQGGARSSSRANLHAARNMSLDDVHRIPESRSPSIPPGQQLSRRSSSSSTPQL